MTPKQAMFVQEYLIDLNAARAAIAAGYSKKTAKQIGQENLTKPDVKKAIDEALAERGKRTEITQDRVLKELARIAFTDPRSVFEWGPGGVTLKDSASLSDDDAAAVAEVSQTITESGGSIKAKMYDKQRALELLGKHLGMFVEKKQIELDATVNLFDPAIRAELLALASDETDT